MPPVRGLTSPPTRDLDSLAERLALDVVLLRLGIRADLRAEFNRLLLWLILGMVALVALAFAAGRVAG